jgi:hypothetical protein
MLGIAAALVPGLAAADVIVLKAGGRIEGQVVEERPDRVVIDVPAGRITLPRTLIEKTVVGSSSLAEFRARAARLAPNDVEGWLALGAWARSRELVTQSRGAYEHVLSIEPANPTAHQALGHVFVDGRWLTLDESYRARGLVQFDGQWVSLEERQALIEERAVHAAERRERLESEARIREADARARTAEAEARRAEAAEAAAADMDEGIPFPYAYGGGYGVPFVGSVEPVPPPVVVIDGGGGSHRDREHDGRRSRRSGRSSTPRAASSTAGRGSGSRNR